MDGDFDYSRLSRTQLEEALTRIDKGRYPVNYQRILKELEARPPDSQTPPTRPEQSVLNLIAWYSIGLVVAYLVAYGCAGLVVTMLLAVLYREVPAEPVIPRLLDSLIWTTAPLVLYLHLVRSQPGRYLRVATGVAIAASVLCAVISSIPTGVKAPKPATVFVATLMLNFAVASLVGTLSGMRHLKPPANNR
jgi:hypothetical protein